MAQLAIKGHATRGSEVIALLEMLGGNNANNCYGRFCDRVYCINENGYIDQDFIAHIEQDTKFIIFTLEEFLEKFPYKVGDEVWLHYENLTIRVTETITCMRWCNKCNCVLYDVVTCSNLREYAFTPYKEETTAVITIDDFKANTKEWLIDKLHGMIISDAIKTIGNIHDELHKPKYPKTYEECCEFLSLGEDGRLYTKGYKASLIQDFQKIFICRNAYWKIAGEQMGLGKPWEPDWENKENTKYCITTINRQVKTITTDVFNYFLVFPTFEMRNAFFENFKDLIENCKELL